MKSGILSFLFRRVALLAALLLVPCSSPAYSVLTHEQIVDFVWNNEMRKILLDQYPNTTPEQMRVAHAYAYGGCLIQDMGYYPAGNKFFSDLVHYVRTGDFVNELIRESRDVNELAFALGALAHYASDNTGHPAINESVAIVFPKLREEYGNHVTYEENNRAHIQTEFGFDVLEVAQQRYTSQAYHDFIGFQVAQPLLERAFLKTYGISLRDVFPDVDRSIESYRRAVSKWIPRLTQVALITKKKELEAVPNFSPKRFRYILHRSEYEREWGKNYSRPGFLAKFLAVVVKILPKIGPLRSLDVKPPTPQTEKLFIKSVEDTEEVYRQLLVSTGEKHQPLPNRDLDTGKPTIAGDYHLADKTYAKLLHRLADGDFAQTSPALRENILDYYSDLNRPFETKQHKDEWKQAMRELENLKGANSSAIQRTGD